MEETMRGFTLLGDRRSEVRDFPVPLPGPGEIRFRVYSAGICGSDLHFYHESPTELDDRRGRVIGHEPSGVVDSVGLGVVHFSIGDRVTVNHTLGCGKCEYCLGTATMLCRENYRGMAQDGRGGDAEYCIMPQENLVHLHPDLTFTDGSFLSCTGATAWGALSKIPKPVESGILLFGLGPIGLSVALLAHQLRIRVVAVNRGEERRRFAERVVPGLETRHPTELIDDFGKSLLSWEPDATIETSGAAAAQQAGIRLVRPRGTAVLVGLTDTGVEKPTIDPGDIIHHEKRVIGSKVLPMSEVPHVSAFLVEHGFHFDDLVGEKAGIEHAPELIARFDAGMPGKFIIEPQNLMK